MSYAQLSEGFSRWFTPLACGPGHPELSKSHMDMASKLLKFTFTFAYLHTHGGPYLLLSLGLSCCVPSAAIPGLCRCLRETPCLPKNAP